MNNSLTRSIRPQNNFNNNNNYTFNNNINSNTNNTSNTVITHNVQEQKSTITKITSQNTIQ